MKMKGKMKEKETEAVAETEVEDGAMPSQELFNEIARLVYLGECTTDSRSEALKQAKPIIVAKEAKFRKGISAKFTIDGKIATCTLAMKMTPRWEVQDLVFTMPPQ